MLSDYRQSTWAIRAEALKAIKRAANGPLTTETRSRVRDVFGEDFQVHTDDGLLEIPDETLAAAIDEARARELTVTGGVAVLSLKGVITPYPSLMSLLFGGGGGLQGFRSQLREVANNDEVTQIVIDIDSPGGVCDLVAEAWADLAAVDKPTVAVANTMAASAAYWIASAADEIVVTPSGEVGSIGCFLVHDDWSGFNAQLGIDPTYISFGEHKVEGNPDEPLSDEARAEFQRSVDEIGATFVDAVAEGRGVTAKKVMDDFGQGRMFSAERAVALGMADRAETLEEAIVRAVGGGASSQARANGATAASETRALPVADGAPESRDAAIMDAEVRKDDEGTVTIAGYAAVFETDSLDLGGFVEVIKRGAFRKVLGANPDVRFIALDHRGMPLARTTNGTLRLSERPKGLWFEADMPDTQAARDLATAIERGDITQMSFRFRVQEDGREWHFPEDQAQLPRRTIREFSDLLDVSPVSFAAYPETEVEVRTAVCGLPLTSGDGLLDHVLVEAACDSVHTGDVAATSADRLDLEYAAELLDFVTPWQSERALRATGDEPEGAGATAEPPGEPDADTDTEAVPYGLAVRSRRLSLLERELGS